MNNFQEFLKNEGFEVKVMPASTRTAQEAADAIGCSVAEIVKSIIFRTEDGEALLVAASGVNRVDEKIIENYLGKKLGKADAEFVREKTGFVIGGVPPFGHKNKIITFIDEDLLRFEYVWAAAGTPFSVFKLRPKELVKLSQGKEKIVH